MKRILLALVLVWGSASRAADSVPSPGNLPGADYPRIATDSSVTVRIKATEAKSVKLEGGTGLVKEPLALTRGTDGVWSVTTPPAVPGFHYYWFNIDGVRVNDPGTPGFFGYGRECSGIDVPEAGVDFYDAKNVPHGEVHSRWYFSRVTGAWRRANIYTPADYDTNRRARYPVLHILHGAGENERGWVQQGHANFILDNLIAAKKAKPMILVVDSGYAPYPAGSGTNQPSGNPNALRTAAFEEVLLKEIIPMIDANFRTVPKPGQRAMAGLSMGSGQTLNIALRHPETFAWIGAMSGAPRPNFEVATAYDGAFRDAAAFNKKVRLLWFSAGTAETRMLPGLVQMHETLEKAGIKNTLYLSDGTDHEWQTWRRSLHELAQKLF